MLEAGVNASGFVTALVRSADDEPLRFAIGPIGGALVTARLPEGAAHVAFADARRGLAWSDPPLRIQRTLDGGFSWHDLPLPIEGDMVAIAPRDYYDLATTTPRESWAARPERCTAARCLVGNTVVVQGWGPVSPQAGRRILAVRADASPPEHPSPRSGWGIDGRLPRFRCEPTGAATPRAPLRTPAPANVRGREVEWSGVEGGLKASFWFDPTLRVRCAFAWRGLDARGEYVAASSPSRCPMRVLEDRERRRGLETLVLRPVLLTRDALQVLVEPIGGLGILSMVRAARGAEARVEPFREYVMFSDYLPSFLGEGLFVMPTFAGGDDSRGVLVVDTDGAPGLYRATRLFFGTRAQMPQAAPPVAIARRGGVSGLAARLDAPSASIVLYPQHPDDALPEALPWRDEGPIAPCDRPPRPDGTSLILGDPRYPPSPPPLGQAAPDARDRITLELSDAGACLREAVHATSASVTRVRARDDGSLEASETTPTASQPLRCVAQ